MKKWLEIILYVLVGIVTISMPFVTYGNWKDQQLFTNGEKQATIATIIVDESNVKTYYFDENDYGVDASNSAGQDGDQITIYFLKSQPYIVAENPYVYHSKLDIFMPLVWFIIVILFLVLQTNKKFYNKRTNVENKINC